MSDPTKAVFLSYAREDAEYARRIADALRAFGLEVWFDQNELRGGDSWDQKIRGQIRACALFVPIISARTQERTEGYFRREWKLAVDRLQDMAGGVAFIVPVVIDETREDEALVPDEFMRVQWTRLAHGVPTPEFVQQVTRLMTKEAGGRRREAGDGSRETGTSGRGTGNRGQGTGHKEQGTGDRRQGAGTWERSPGKREQGAAPTRRGFPVAGWIAIGVVVVGVAAVVMVNRTDRTKPAAGSTQAPAAQPPPALAPARAEDKSIAVLPFANMSEDQEASGFFTDGIHEDVLTNLALIREFRVVSRTSVQPYRATTKPMRQIAQELGVTYILEGSVRRAGNRVRVTGQLIRAATDEHVWAQAYDRDLTDIFAIQSELSQQIATALKTALSPEEKSLLARRPTENPAAYDLFLQARDIDNREGNTVVARTRRIALLEEAVKLDPQFAQAWAELAVSCAFWYFGNVEGMEAKLARAKVAIERAMQLAPGDPEVFSSLGTYYYYGFRDYTRAAEQYERRARLQPNAPVVFNSLSLILRRQGRWAESLPNARRACELDPANISYLRNLFATLRAARRWDEALTVQRRIAALLPDSLVEAYDAAVIPYVASGSTREAEAFFAGLTPAQRESPRGLSLQLDWARARGDFAAAVQLGRRQPYFDEDGDPRWQQAAAAALDLLAQGDPGAARARLGDFPAELRTKIAQEPKNSFLWMILAQMEVVLGNHAEAVRCAERAVELMPESRDALDGVQYAKIRARIYDWAGRREEALAEYARLLRVPSPFVLDIQGLRTGFTTLRGDPRFEALLNDPRNNAPLF